MYNKNDLFIEEMVRKDNHGRAGLLKFGIVILAVIIAGAVFIFFSPMFPVVTALTAAGAFLGFKYTVTEYEYSFIRSGVDADLDVDRIMGQRKRTRLISVNCKQVRRFEPAGDSEFSRGSGKTVDASLGKNSAELWYLTTAAGDGGEITLCFNPSERLREAIQQSLPRTAGR